MGKKLYNEDYINDIALAIREKSGSSDRYTVSQMAQAILDIKGKSVLYPVYDVQSNLKSGIKISPSWSGGSGSEISDDTYTATDYIPVTPGETLFWIKTSIGEYACGYTENKEGIYDNGAGYQSVSRQYRDCGPFSSFSVPNNMHFIRFSNTTSNMLNPMFNFYRMSGDNLPDYMPTPFDIDITKCKGVRITGDWSNNPGVESFVSDSYITTDYIPVTPGESLYWFCNRYGRNISEYACGYDETKTPMFQQGLASICSGAIGTYIVPEGMKYIRFSNDVSAILSGLCNFYRTNLI